MAKKSHPPLARKPASFHAAPRSTTPPITISGRWLTLALPIALGLAILCAYATLCLLFYQGQWQLMVHPSHTITATPASAGLQFDEIRFDDTETGLAQLNGWWIPAEPNARWSENTLLYLHDGAGSLSDSVDDLAALHALGINIFAFDYRGFGRSANLAPREKRMSQDAEAAWTYLVETRHRNPQTILIYGAGVGASLAADLAARHAPAAVVFDAPTEPALKIIGADARAKILPLSLLLNERFDPSDTLKNLTTPKLFLDRKGARPRTEHLFELASFPKEYFELGPEQYDQTMRRFLDEALH